MKKIFIFFYIFLLVFTIDGFAKRGKAEIKNFTSSLLDKDTLDTISLRNFKSGLSLKYLWKYKTGDDHSWASVDFDDNDWRKIITDSTDNDTLLKKYKGIAWFRTSFVIDSAINGIPLALKMRTNGACNVFIDGRLVRSLGVVGKTASEEVSGFSLRTCIIPVPSNAVGRHFLAFRSSNYGFTGEFGYINIEPGLSISGFDAELISMQKALDDQKDISAMTIPIFFCGVFIVLSIFHLILFLYYRKNRSNLYYSLFTLFIFIIFFSVYRTVSGTDLRTTQVIFTLGFWSFVLVPLFFIGILYEVFYKRLLIIFWILSGLLAASCASLIFLKNNSIGAILLGIFLLGGFIETIRVFIRAWVKKREGSRIFLFGIFFPVIGVIVISIVASILRRTGLEDLAANLSGHRAAFFGYSLLMSVSISMTIYLARDFARMNHKLHEQIKEIKQLFSRSSKSLF